MQTRACACVRVRPRSPDAARIRHQAPLNREQARREALLINLRQLHTATTSLSTAIDSLSQAHDLLKNDLTAAAQEQIECVTARACAGAVD